MTATESEIEGTHVKMKTVKQIYKKKTLIGVFDGNNGDLNGPQPSSGAELRAFIVSGYRNDSR